MYSFPFSDIEEILVAVQISAVETKDRSRERENSAAALTVLAETHASVVLF